MAITIHKSKENSKTTVENSSSPPALPQLHLLVASILTRFTRPCTTHQVYWDVYSSFILFKCVTAMN
ncbi:hypothetical protein RIR_jg1083.t1 [Rhizophagus irregularis DAOM 181602=DAOM 197198]|uniref:Uncharacterized protein n=1 Tax=Rhizophagus irregularis (strain DAOM 181602 / DAOM 197198 / MUCL 43194) TaxID=747089 RepID=U9U594_RHIID|nr:hypothetical protein RIR_jg1083.t1 [Rhizophagus irregularis DAOM 181602=DAOM 197198]